MTLDKVYHGGLAAQGSGEMPGVLSPDGQGVYVAVERINGILDGRSGSFPWSIAARSAMASRGLKSRSFRAQAQIANRYQR